MAIYIAIYGYCTDGYRHVQVQPPAIDGVVFGDRLPDKETANLRPTGDGARCASPVGYRRHA